MHLIEAFVRRHMRRATALGLPAQSFLDEAAVMRPQVMKAYEELERATERLLQAASDVADERVKKAGEIMAMVAEVKRAWPTMTAEARQEWGPSLQRWKEKRKKWLSAIPLEERQRLEAKYEC